MSKCKYCGADLTKAHRNIICVNCSNKKPLVEKLVKIFQVIKRECGVEDK